MDIARFKKLPAMGILRGVKLASIAPLIDAIIASGLETIEITMNSPDAASLIKESAGRAGKRLMIGAGTILNIESMKVALDAGATFVVMPNLIDEVMEHCVKNVIPVFPGALTPKEIHEAWDAGATMVKIFPAGVFGPAYFREIKAPFNNIELMACGGVNRDNIKTYFANGASAIAFGESIFKKELLARKDFNSIAESIKALISGVKKI